jgi:multiple sugar transport system ATP-binding protein
MTLADRIVVINDRTIQQVGAPMEIYDRPANSFVAQFVGSPPMTLAPATLMPSEGEFARLRLADGCEVQTRVRRDRLPAGGLNIGFRPEAVRVASGGDVTTSAKVELVERLGDRTLIYARLADGQAITAEDEGYSRVAINDDVGLKFDGDAAHVFGADGTGHHADQRAS